MPAKEFVISRTEMEAILQEESIGFLGLAAGTEPYVVPVNYTYSDGKILIHGAPQGKKVDCLRANPRVCFTVGRQAGPIRRHAGGDPCHPDSDSVICCGRARIVEDVEERCRLLNAFQHSMQPGAAEIPVQVAARCCAIEIEIAEMTGRRERGKSCTHWRYRFTSAG